MSGLGAHARMRVMRRTAWLWLLVLVGCGTASLPLPSAWKAGPAAAVIGDYCAPFKCAAKAQVPSVRIVGNRILNGDKPLTPQFVAIDSFDVSLDRKEIVFSAKRQDNFDIGLVSLDGSD